MSNVLRIVAKPQRWLWWTNAVIQLPLAVLMFAVMLNDKDADSTGMRIFMGVLGVVCLALWVFSIRVLLRLRAGPLELVVSDENLQVPSMLRGDATTVRIADIEKALLQEIRTNGVSFFQLVVTHRVGAKNKGLVIAQQLVGKDALTQVCEALRERGVTIG
jgi:hypothetical protein